MTAVEVVQLNETTLKNATLVVGAEAVNIYVDPWATTKLPAVNIEADKTLTEIASDGTIVRQDHSLTIMCLVSAQGKAWATYKVQAETLAAAVIQAIAGLNPSPRISEKGYSELMIGAEKASAVAITVEFVSQ